MENIITGNIINITKKNINIIFSILNKYSNIYQTTHKLKEK